MSRRLRLCVEAWPECYTGGYNPSCCRFPKSCSCDVYEPQYVTEADLEPLYDDVIALDHSKDQRRTYVSKERFEAAERECAQLRAERDQALALLRQVRATMEPVTEGAIKFLPKEDGKRYTFAAGFNSAAFAVRQHIDQSGLLDDEGQQR